MMPTRWLRIAALQSACCHAARTRQCGAKISGVKLYVHETHGLMQANDSGPVPINKLLFSNQ